MIAVACYGRDWGLDTGLPHGYHVFHVVLTLLHTRLASGRSTKWYCPCFPSDGWLGCLRTCNGSSGCLKTRINPPPYKQLHQHLTATKPAPNVQILPNILAAYSVNWVGAKPSVGLIRPKFAIWLKNRQYKPVFFIFYPFLNRGSPTSVFFRPAFSLSTSMKIIWPTNVNKCTIPFH